MVLDSPPGNYTPFFSPTAHLAQDQASFHVQDPLMGLDSMSAIKHFHLPVHVIQLVASTV